MPLHNACSYGHYDVTELLIKVIEEDFVQTCGNYNSFCILEQIMSADKYPCIFSCQKKKDIVYIS